MNLSKQINLRKDEKAKTESYFSTTEMVAVNTDLIKYLTTQLSKNDQSSIRISLHKDAQATFHQMIIAHRKGHYYRPHKHLKKVEAYHLISGAIQVVIYDDQGHVDKSVRVAAPGEEMRAEVPFIYRIGANHWHCVIPLTEIVVFHEAKEGPFIAEEDSLYPPWAPDGKNREIAMQYIDKILSGTV